MSLAVGSILASLFAYNLCYCATVVKTNIIEAPIGPIEGTDEFVLDQTVTSFLGVPFAKPPIGSRRFAPPEPIESWDNVFQANKLARACYQENDGTFGEFWGSNMWNANTEKSEDCLQLNMWAPKNGKKLAVMVWLFGGGFWYGSPSLTLYDGRVLAAQGNVIVININYRVGPFGFLFLDHPLVPGNMGLLDQQLALQWIHDNIEAFGGDPSRVTLFGESAGAASVVAHMIAPNSKELFRNGILESGSLDNSWAMDAPKKAKKKSWQLVTAVECDVTEDMSVKVLECLREKPIKELSSAIWSISVEFLEFPLVIVSKDENFFSKEDAFRALRNGRYRNDVDLIIGLNQDEGNFWNIYYLSPFWDKWNSTESAPHLSKEEFLTSVDKAFGRFPHAVRQGIAFTYWDIECKHQRENGFYTDKVNQMVGDSFFSCDALWLADQLSTREYGKVYVYYFAKRSSTNPWPPWTGVMHGYEIEFVFGVPLRNISTYSDSERQLAKAMTQLWSSFASDDEPSSTALHLRSWPVYKGGDERLEAGWLRLGGRTPLTMTNALKEKECKTLRDARDIEYELDIVPAMSAAFQIFTTVGTLAICIVLFVI